jgi:twitching motility two-component system response regulator PilH
LARRILLADDSVTAQNMGRRILTDAGYEVVTVNNGSAALKKIQEQKPDLIVLDVYMPGYGGLEVCQRIKEGSETTRIPVLLTVGKLEPFKPDEAKRVRADAFIVKPFEASELLTALTKLEDKIVPQAQPAKSGRFAKALAAVESSDDGFGDSETGWKERLIIPTPSARRAEPGIERFEPPVSVPRQAPQQEGEFRPAESKGSGPVPAGLPPDITPEEVAAISAAAAAFAGGAPTTVAELGGVIEASEPKSETIAEASAAEKIAPHAIVASAAPVFDSEAVKVSEEPVGINPATVSTEIVPPHQGSGDVASADAIAGFQADDQKKSLPSNGEANWNKDAEVLAALASLAPVETPPADFAANVNQALEQIHVPAGVPGVAAVSPNGPRWIAEAIAPTAEESSLLLEQEMEKALTAVAATRVEASSESAAAGVSPGLESTAAANAEAVSLGTAFTSQSEAGEARPSSAEAAYAAAAGSASAIECPRVEPIAPSPAVAQEITQAAPDQGEHQESELAAAWQNWKEIRETVVGSPADAEAAATARPEAIEEPTRPMQAEPAQDQSEQPIVEDEDENEEDESAADEEQKEPAVIASIVDNMLAELRPKLVEEIMRKMSSAKKAKAKKKK